MPLVAREFIVGAISLGRTDAARQFAETDVTLVESLASTAALAIDNARLYDDAQRAVRSREDVVAIVSHDLRNPLNVIVLYADLLRDRVRHDTQAVEQATSIVDAAERMSRLIADLLDAERIETGNFDLDEQVWPVSEILDDALVILAPIAAQKGVKLVVSAGGCNAWLSCDRERVRQVFSNVIGNAIKFTPVGGSVVVRSEDADDEVRFIVTDTGCGIAATQLPHIFERYWKSETHPDGVGLGLFIVKAIVGLHGGSIAAESTEGAGTRIAFTLPAAAATLSAVSSTLRPQPS